MYGVDKLPPAELHLHRAVAEGHAKRLREMLKELSQMHEYVKGSDLMSAAFTDAFKHTNLQTLYRLFDGVTDEVEKRQAGWKQESHT